MNTALDNLQNQLSWAAHFKVHPSSASLPFRAVRKRMCSPYLEGSVPVAKKAFDELRSHLVSLSQGVRAYASKTSHSWWCNYPGILKRALDWIENSNVSIVPADRGGRFVIVHDVFLSFGHSRIFKREWYIRRPKHVDDIDSVHDICVPVYRSLARRLNKLDERFAVSS